MKRSKRLVADLDRLAEDIPTTTQDVAALKAARARGHFAGRSLAGVHLLKPASWLSFPPRRTTAEGWEPLEL